MTTIAFDTETLGFNWYDGETAFLASWADESNEYVADLGTADGVTSFMKALDAADTLVAHNLSFDTHQVQATLDRDILSEGKELHDTDIMARIAVPTGQARGSYGLKNLAATFLDPDAKESEDAIKDMAKTIGVKMSEPGAYKEVWRAYPEVMEKYAKMDARFTYDLYERWKDDLSESPSYALERQVVPILTRAEGRGIAVDQGVVESLKAEYEPLAEQAYNELEGVLGAEALGGEGSKAAMLEALQGIGVPLYRRTENGALKTDKYALAEFEDDFPILKVLGDYRTYNIFLNTFIGPAIGREVVHTSFSQCEAWTGRMSSRRPNMQNIPKRAGKSVRAMFVPREGHAFVVFDYESIEVRLLAYYMGNQGFRDMIREGHDPHAWMAAQIHGGDPASFAKGTEGEAARDVAKNTLFAITYGAGAPRVSDMNKITKKEAKALISKIKTSLPGYYRLNSRIRNKVEQEGHVNTVMGRKNPVNPEKSYVGLNALIQGSAADIMKKGLVQVDEAVREMGGTPLLVVHDEIVVEVPTENAQAAADAIGPALTEAYPLDPPLSVEGGIVTTNYADA